MDESVFRNLDTQHRMLADLERHLDSDLDDEHDQTADAAPLVDVPFSRALSYQDLTSANDALRAQHGWDDVNLYEALTVTHQGKFVAWLDAQRLPWTRDDLLALGFAGVVGAAATVFDTQLDGAVRTALGSLKNTDLVQGWEVAGKRLPIDYTGKGVGGPSHRVKSAGHDLGRPLEALRQIRDGVFRGYAFPHGVKTPVIKALSTWQQIDSWPEAMIVWMKHLGADIVTPMSLPLPGFSLLYEMDNQTIREFVHAAYQGQRPLGNGLNVRSGLMTPALSMLSIEAIIRTHMLIRAYQSRGTVELTAPELALQGELLLAGHGLVGAVAIGKATAVLLLTKNPAFAVRHLNVPVLLRIGSLGLATGMTVRQRAKATAPSWDDLLQQWAQPWQLDAALDVEREAQRLQAQ